jgi:hypothetical protein
VTPRKKRMAEEFYAERMRWLRVKYIYTSVEKSVDLNPRMGREAEVEYAGLLAELHEI